MIVGQLVAATRLEVLQPRDRGRYDEARQARMKTALQRVLETPGLSTDSYEIAIKSLGQDGNREPSYYLE